MGKIRIKTLGDESLEEQQKKKTKTRHVQKKLAKAPGLKGGQRVVAVGPTEEELARLPSPEGEANGGQAAMEAKPEKKKVQIKKEPKVRGKKYQTAAKLVDKNKTYALTEALELLSKLKTASFDETVELHINTTETGVSGDLTLPHGTGKKMRVVIASGELLTQIEKGKIDFDVLLSSPQMMPKLAKVAKFLGPRGLMPNPKNGTITEKPEEVAKQYEAGKMTFKTETKAPVIHLTVGKLSFGEQKLADNIKTVFGAIPQAKVTKVVLKSTMSPGIKLNTSTL